MQNRKYFNNNFNNIPNHDNTHWMLTTDEGTQCLNPLWLWHKHTLHSMSRQRTILKPQQQQQQRIHSIIDNSSCISHIPSLVSCLHFRSNMDPISLLIVFASLFWSAHLALMWLSQFWASSPSIPFAPRKTVCEALVAMEMYNDVALTEDTQEGRGFDSGNTD